MLRQSLGEREACQTTGGAGEAPASGAGSRCAHRDPPAQAAARSADARKVGGARLDAAELAQPAPVGAAKTFAAPLPCGERGVARGEAPCPARSARKPARSAGGSNGAPQLSKGTSLDKFAITAPPPVAVKHWSTGFAASPDGSCLASASRRAGSGRSAAQPASPGRRDERSIWVLRRVRVRACVPFAPRRSQRGEGKKLLRPPRRSSRSTRAACFTWVPSRCRIINSSHAKNFDGRSQRRLLR